MKLAACKRQMRNGGKDSTVTEILHQQQKQLILKEKAAIKKRLSLLIAENFEGAYKRLISLLS